MPKTVRVDGEFNIYRAAELKTQLLEALVSDTELDLDLSGVSELDSAGLQLLLLLKRCALEQQRSLRFVNHSPAVVEVLDLTNLAQQFGDPIVLASGRH